MDRYRNEVNRLYGVLNSRLADRAYAAGEYSIADMAIYPWIVPYERQGQKIEDFPHLKRWFDAITSAAGGRALLCQGQGDQPERRPASAPRKSAPSCSGRPRRR